MPHRLWQWCWEHRVWFFCCWHACGCCFDLGDCLWNTSGLLFGRTHEAGVQSAKGSLCGRTGVCPEDEMDAQDQTSLHVLGITEQGPVCCARIFWQEPGASCGTCVFGAAAGDKGVGRGLMEEILRKAGGWAHGGQSWGAQCGKEGFMKRWASVPLAIAFWMRAPGILPWGAT